VFDLIWNPAPWNATQDFNATARAWYGKFAQDYLQLAAADAATYALLWEAYFNVSYSESRLGSSAIARAERPYLGLCDCSLPLP